MKRIFLLIFLAINTLAVSQNKVQTNAKNNYLLAENYYREGAYEKATQIY